MYSRDKVVAGNLNIKERDYWLDKLSGDLEKTRFFCDYQRNYSKDVRWDKLKFRLPDAHFSGLMNLSKESDHTLHIILLAGLVVLLYKYTGAKDTIVGSPIYRQDAEGEFINTVLALRNPVDGEKTFKEMLLEVKNTVLKAIDHQNYPIETLLYLMGMKEDGDDFPLFDIVLMLENIHDRKYIQHIKTNMIFSFLKSQEALEGVVEYNANIYKPGTIEQIIRHYLKIFKEALTHLDARLSAISLLTEKEKEQVLFEFNHTKTPLVKDKSYHRLFEEQVEKSPHGTAAIYRGRHITYRVLNETANRIAYYLLKHGVTQNRVVGIYLQRSIKMLAAVLGTFKAGGAYLPVETDYPETRVHYILDNSDVNILITSKDNPRVNDELAGKLPLLTGVLYYRDPEDKIENMLQGFPFHNPGLNHSPANLAYMIYTSGTTGKPKGVMIHQLGMLNHLYAKIDDLSITAADIVAQTASACFDISIWQFLAALLVGGSTCIMDKEVVMEAGKLLPHLQKDRITILESVPSLMSLFLDMVEYERNNELKYLRWMVLTGEPLTPHLARQWYRRYPGIKLINAYGPTEASDDVTHYVLAGPPPETQVSVPIGKPLQNLHIYILDNDLSLCPVGVRGEICVAGIGVGKGYWKDSEKTQRSFLINPFLEEIRDMDYQYLYRTGDTGYFRPDGSIECLGRTDHQVKIRGNRIELGEIEAQLTAYREIKDALVITKDEKTGDQWLCAYIVPYSGDRLNITQLREYLLKQLPDYMVPSSFVQLERFPATANGKIDRKALPEPENDGADVYSPPRGEVEQKLAEIWAEVLRREKDTISVNANFFELGGHSLNATVMVSKIHKTINVKVPLADIFNFPTIRGLARCIVETAEVRYCSIKMVEKKEYYSLSSAQRRLYILQQMALNSTGYNLSFPVLLEGKPDLDRIKRTFKQMIKRHESLRTSFEVVEGTPVQKIHNQVDFAVESYELPVKKRGTGNRPQQAKPIIDEFMRPFDLTKAPLLRMGLIKLETGKHILMLDMHHIITDGSSSGIFVNDFMALYGGEEMPPLKTQYRDFSGWQNSEKANRLLEKKEEFWLRQFAGEVPLLSLPTDFSRPGFLDFAGSSVNFQLDRRQTGKLKKMATAANTTLYILLLAIYNILLSKLSGQEEIIVGSPTAGRNHTDLENVIGMFVNTVAMKNAPTDSKPFTELLKEVKKNTLAAFENQEYQFEDLVDKVVENRDISRNPLFDTMFALQNMDMPTLNVPGLTLHPFEVESRISKFDLTLSGEERQEHLFLTVEYSTSLFLKNTILRFIDYFKKIVSTVLDNKDIKIVDIEILTEEEKKQVLMEFNNTDTAYPSGKTIHQLFKYQVTGTPHHIAVAGPGLTTGPGTKTDRQEIQISYGKLDTLSTQLACRLQAKGVNGDSIVGIMMTRSLEIIISILGILKAGSAFLPVDLDYPLSMKQFMIKDSRLEVLLTLNHLPAKNNFPDQLMPPENILLINDEIAGPAETPTLKAVYNPGSTAYIMYTSGSTEHPKGVMIEHQSVVNYTWWAIKRYVDNNKIRFPLFTSLSFDLTVTSIFTPLLSGNTIVVYEGDIRESLTGKILPENRVGVVKLTPSHLKLIMEQKRNHLRSSGEKMKSNIKCFIVGGEMLEAKLARDIVKTFHETPVIYNEYGPTEATVGCMIYEFSPGTDIRQSVPIGIPADNVYIYLLDKNKKPVPLGIVGEVHISGDGLARGYLNRPELTDEKFIDNPFAAGKRMYKSNDLARFLTDGNVELLGRIDHQVKIRGSRIEVGEIENLLLSHKEIKDAVVIAKENKKRGSYLCAYIVSRSNLAASQLREFLAKELPAYMIPSSFIQVKKIPLTSSGKANRKALALSTIQLQPGPTYVAPQDAVEKKIADIWREVLLVEKVGINDNYFDVGGTSFDIIRINSKLKESLQIDIPVMEMFRYTTVGSLAGHLRSEETRIQSRTSALARGRQAKVRMSQRRRREIHA